MSSPTLNESMNSVEVQKLALDLSSQFPRSPREKLAGYVIGYRTLDKCRAVLAGTAGEYHYNCPLDQLFLGFAGIEADAFKAFVATGANDEAVDAWVAEHSTQKDKLSVVKWNNDLLYKRLSEMPDNLQLYMEDYVATYLPANTIITYWFDIYDIEEGRLACR
jgi:hypothetical protein